ncbi:hypothetical protein ACLGIH_00295 [Streptomyces sp. HMX87]|uniref:hypothetical protein n=1 Tax=Streptomyces sp. HMX87 TaxID=3390849 RepID=UPI003A8BEA90
MAPDIVRAVAESPVPRFREPAEEACQVTPGPAAPLSAEADVLIAGTATAADSPLRLTRNRPDPWPAPAVDARRGVHS